MTFLGLADSDQWPAQLSADEAGERVSARYELTARHFDLRFLEVSRELFHTPKRGGVSLIEEMM
ncbi:MAG TPA: hypothetical protein VES20_21500 [Bryobacteraceae bacterium]|nr:hypothetical protein [Bryobacteraceae bacterium]